MGQPCAVCNDPGVADPRFYLIVGSVLTEAVTSRLKASGERYLGKSLASKPANWETIAELLSRDDLAGVVMKLTAKDYERILREDYRHCAERLLTALSRKRHLVLVHEAVFAPPRDDEPMPSEAEESEYIDFDEPEWNDRVAREYFGVLDPSVRSRVNELLERLQVEVTPYKRNVEASVVASEFVGDLQDGLIFRLYVPAGRIYEDEVSRLLTMFHHWLGAVKGLAVRQAGYQTKHGRVVEFYDESGTLASEAGSAMAEFDRFLGLLDNPPAAAAMLVGLGLAAARADELVTRYGRDARRVLIDARHERDRKLLEVRQRLELELADDMPALPLPLLTDAVESLVPPFAVRLVEATETPRALTRGVVINNQFIGRVEGVVAQVLNGDVTYGTPADDLIRIVRELNVPEQTEVEAAARQLSDSGAPGVARTRARHVVKSFLLRNAARIESSVYGLIWDWVKDQVT